MPRYDNIQRKMMMASNSAIWRAVLFGALPIVAISILTVTIGIAFGQTNTPSPFVIRRVEIWALFYRGMVAAFVIGALVQGATVYCAWKYRESNKKTHPPVPGESAEGMR
jgi:heme/copper-type cytochrome/quinol oxidase subunit 2